MYFLPSEKSPAQAIKKTSEDSEITAESPQDNEFISDAFQGDQINEEDLKKEMEMLGVEDGKFKDEGNHIHVLAVSVFGVSHQVCHKPGCTRGFQK